MTEHLCICVDAVTGEQCDDVPTAEDLKCDFCRSARCSEVTAFQ